GYTLKDPSRVDDVVAEALEQDRPTIVNVYVDSTAAPLPGKIVKDEAINYGKWAYRSITEDRKLDWDEIPPLSTAAKRFF
ncbi:pyruvate oxidase, partial [Staphylococcus epidermidis]